MGQSYISPKSPPEKHTFDLCLTHRPLTYSEQTHASETNIAVLNFQSTFRVYYMTLLRSRDRFHVQKKENKL